jgi:hypothetical protein
MRLLLRGLVLVFLTTSTAFAANFEAKRNEEWFRCHNSSDCVVIDVAGCPWGISAVNREYPIEFREWAQAENARHDCYKKPSANKGTVSMFDAECVNERCVIREKTVN